MLKATPGSSAGPSWRSDLTRRLREKNAGRGGRPPCGPPDAGRDHLEKTPKVVGGLTRRNGDLAATFHRAFVHEVEVVSTPREAERAKLIENTFRHVNIALGNELAFLSKDLDVDVWDRSAPRRRSPSDSWPFRPGPRVGGHSLVIDASYLSWRVGQRPGHRFNFVGQAQEVGSRMR